MKINITTRDKNLDESVDVMEKIVLGILDKYSKAKSKKYKKYFFYVIK